MNLHFSFRFHGLRNDSDVAHFSHTKLRDQSGIIWTEVNNREINRTRDAIRLVNNSHLSVIKAGTGHFYRNYKFWKKYGLNKYPSTGFYFINCALTLCSEVNVFGFWPFNVHLHGVSVDTHYYSQVRLARHDFLHEVSVLLSMHQLGMIKMHVEKCA